ncbi:tetratricopeptide repeat protein [Marinobacter sp. JSM 1782161]|uniref:tetratricopeptide repeat protein n=1 Tax=Marinobacter sp. JSM 1782161 TaxID=2685906 RepID=UPI001402FC7A|nr:tetratricopeptide repeat protein [Marinobacter sp. JSM 1782161]
MTPSRWLACVAGLLLLLGTTPTQAQANAMRESVYNGLEKARDQVGQSRYPAAMAALERLAGLDDLSGYERAQIFNLRGYALSRQGRSAAAVKRYERLVAIPGLPDALLQSARRNLAQLAYQLERYEQALTWLDALPPSVLADDIPLQRLRAHCLYLLEAYADAAAQLEKTVAQQPEEASLNLLRAAYQQLGDYASAADTLERLVDRYPKTDYLRALATLYGMLDQPRRQLGLLASLHSQDALDAPQEWQALASLYLQQDMPWRAARLMASGIERGQLAASVENRRYLAQAWFQANENDQALAVLEDLARSTDDGAAEMLMGRTYLRQLRWAEAAGAFEQALAEQVDDRARANLLLGVARLRANRLGAARQALARAANDPSTRSAAQQWLTFLDQRVAAH